KDVRSNTDIGANPVSAASAGISLARQIFTSLEASCALLIGAGEMIDLAARHLAGAGIHKMIFANRSPERAQALAARHHGLAIPLDDIPAHLPEADLLVSSTAAQHTLVSASDLKGALRARRRKPVVVLDLALPRDIDPTAAESADIYLSTIDDHQRVVDQGRRSRQQAD